jgi:hypothetical protein
MTDLFVAPIVPSPLVDVVVLGISGVTKHETHYVLLLEIMVVLAGTRLPRLV